MWGSGKPLLAFILGDPDRHGILEPALTFLRGAGIDYQVVCLQANSEVREVEEFAEGAQESGIRALVVLPGEDLHLPSHVARRTVLPVIAVPQAAEDTSALARMPHGVPVAVLGPGQTGALNAVALALEILSVSDPAFGPVLDSLRNEEPAS